MATPYVPGVARELAILAEKAMKIKARPRRPRRRAGAVDSDRRLHLQWWPAFAQGTPLVPSAALRVVAVASGSSGGSIPLIGAPARRARAMSGRVRTANAPRAAADERR
jgi:hypothetical protein